MKEYLEKIIPVYAESIFGEGDVSKYIQSIEVIGFASPIYKGKYVDPRSLEKESRAALNYNMDLSYKRARAIFRYITDRGNMNYGKQKALMERLTVAGRSYLQSVPMEKMAENNIKMDDFCKSYDCEQFHRAVIRFNLIK